MGEARFGAEKAEANRTTSYAPGDYSPKLEAPNSYQAKVGEYVDARWGETWYRAKILKVNPDGTYDIRWLDGNCKVSSNYAATLIRKRKPGKRRSSGRKR